MLTDKQIKDLKPGDVLYRGFTDVTRARKVTIVKSTIKSVSTQPVIIAESEEGGEEEFECHNTFFATFCTTRLEALEDVECSCVDEIIYLEKKILLEEAKRNMVRAEIESIGGK